MLLNKNVVGQQFDRVISEHWPKILEIFNKKIGPTALRAVKNDAACKLIFTSLHASLPLPIRLCCKKEPFVQYCFDNRDKFLQYTAPNNAGQLQTHSVTDENWQEEEGGQ